MGILPPGELFSMEEILETPLPAQLSTLVTVI